MFLIDYILIWICVAVSLFLQLLCYKELTNEKLKIGLIFILAMIFCSALTVVNIYFNYSFTKLIVSFCIITINCYFAFKEDINYLFIKSVFIYLLIALSEVILSIGLLTLNISNLIDFDSNIIIKILFSIIVMVNTLLICKLKYIKSFARKLVDKISTKLSNLFYLIVSMLLVTFLGYKFVSSFDTTIYLLNVLILICFCALMTVALNSYLRTQKAIHKQKMLLNFMSKYEKMIDDGRINRHEMLNNLLILRSVKNKNSKEYQDLLDDLIKTYDSSKDSVKNIYNLPSGLKGILYYKIYDMRALKIDVSVNITKRMSQHFKNISSKDYKDLCRVIAIILDNAKDAAASAKDKYILIEFYLEKSELIFSVENSFKESVDINKLSTMNYSTKGKGRGLGLYIAHNIIQNTNVMSIEQKIINGNFFSTILKIKIKD